ncbi:hypothetical protein [Qipengyuania sp. 902]|uniref:hypothetical protein n=1 Tax=Qipengyuania sp. 902 TaxID=3417565 RepID=UPI003EB6D762
MPQRPFEERFERPEYISIAIMGELSPTPINLESILWEEDLQPGDAKRKNALYLPKCPVSERDEALGLYLAEWSKVERRIKSLIAIVMRQSLEQTTAITSLGLNIKQTRI